MIRGLRGCLECERVEDSVVEGVCVTEYVERTH